jgi:hypothetical protein
VETLRPASCFVPGGDARKSARSRARVGRRRRGPGRPRALGPGDAGARRRRPESPPPRERAPAPVTTARWTIVGASPATCLSFPRPAPVLTATGHVGHCDLGARTGWAGGPARADPPPGRGDHAHPGRHGAHPDSSPPPAGPPGRSGEGQGHQGLSRRYGTACSFACETTYETHIKIKNCKAI